MAVQDFKGDQGLFLTKGLFYEHTTDKTTAIYTLKDRDYMGLPSLRNIFLSLNDPTGYLLATQYLGGWEHLKTLLNVDWFVSHYTKWQEELEVKLRATALNRLIREAENEDSKFYVDMNKMLLNKGWIDPDLKPTRRGAPSKADIRKEAKRQLDHGLTINDDFKRLSLGGTN